MRKEFLNIIPLISNLAKRREGLRQMASEQIGEMAEALAHAMHLGENLVQDVRLAGILFDVGKVALPDAVLGKPEESLTHQEWELYKTYPEIGGTLLKTVEPLQGAAAIVQAQQEHFDGSGYPSGLISDRIPQGARILAVVRDYLALQVGMITPQKLSKGQALDYIKKHTFVRYDSMVVSAFEKLLAGKSSARKVSGTADDPSGGSELARNILDNDPSILADANPAKVGHGSSEKPAGSVRSGERELGVEELEDGMVLARDVKNREGKVILFRGFKLSAALIKKLVGYERNIKTRMAIYIREDT